MRDLLIAAVLLIGWAILQFGVEPESGWIHLALVAGVLMLIKGIAESDGGSPAT